MPHASEALGLSPVALLITDLSPSCNFRGFITDRQRHTLRTAQLVTSACMLSLAFLSLDGLHAPSHLCFYVGALKAVFLSSFSDITTSFPQESAACAFITRDQRLSSSRRLTDIALTEPEQLNNLIQLSGGRLRLPFGDTSNQSQRRQTPVSSDQTRTHRTRATRQLYSAQPGVVRGFRLRTY